MPLPYTVEKNVPIPANTGSYTGARPRIYPFNTMDVGDSFGMGSKEEARRVTAAASSYSKTHGGGRFSVQQVPGGGYRCWRIS